MSRSMHAIAIAVAIMGGIPHAWAQSQIGEVSTSFRLLGKNDKVTVTRYDDPRVANVSCYVSRAVTGGVSGSLGLAEDKSQFSVACRALGPVTIPSGLPDSQPVFEASASPLFKTITVHRMVDREKNVLAYLVVSTRLIDGSPANSISVVPVDVQR